MNQPTQPNFFGFSAANASGDFTPYIKYDARSSMFTRVDRVLDNAGQWASSDYILRHEQFCAIFDLENLETGALNFSGASPQMHLIKVSDLMAGRAQLPPCPSKDFKHGLRVLIKLHPTIGGDKPVREMTSSAKSWVRGVQALYANYLREAPQRQGMLPVVTCPQVTLVRSGSGAKQSANFDPTFQIVDWVQRPHDLVWKPREQTQAAQPAPQQGFQAPPPGYQTSYTPPPQQPAQQYAPQGFPPQQQAPQQWSQPAPQQQQPPWNGGQGAPPNTGTTAAPPPPQGQQVAPPQQAAPPPVGQPQSAPQGGFNARDFG